MSEERPIYIFYQFLTEISFFEFQFKIFLLESFIFLHDTVFSTMKNLRCSNYMSKDCGKNSNQKFAYFLKKRGLRIKEETEKFGVRLFFSVFLMTIKNRI